jgi:hypothetical protein
VYEVLLNLIPEGVTTIGLLVILGLGHYLLKLWVGEDAVFFDQARLKVRYAFDLSDLVVLSRFLWMSVRKFR